MATRRPEEQRGEGGRGEGGRGRRDLNEGGGSHSHSPCPMRPGKVDTVALDIRPLHDYEKSGVGHLGKVQRKRNRKSKSKSKSNGNRVKSSRIVSEKQLKLNAEVLYL